MGGKPERTRRCRAQDRRHPARDRGWALHIGDEGPPPRARAAQEGAAGNAACGPDTAPAPECGRPLCRQGARLEEALNAPETRPEATETLRALIDEIRLTPKDGSLQIELFGELGAILALGEATNANRAGDMPTRFSLVAGIGFEPMTFRL